MQVFLVTIEQAKGSSTDAKLDGDFPRIVIVEDTSWGKKPHALSCAYTHNTFRENFLTEQKQPCIILTVKEITNCVKMMGPPFMR